MPDAPFPALDGPPGRFVFTEDAGRPRSAEGWLVRQAAPRDHQAQADLPGKPAGYHAGHLIPACFGGPGDVRNLVPMPDVKNTSYVKAVENAIGRLLAYGPVYLRVTVEYAGDGRLPAAVRHQLFHRTADGALRPMVGGDVYTNLADLSDARMSDARIPYTGRKLAPKDFLDVASARGRSPFGDH